MEELRHAGTLCQALFVLLDSSTSLEAKKSGQHGLFSNGLKICTSMPDGSNIVIQRWGFARD
jgi:hypothetical protein